LKIFLLAAGYGKRLQPLTLSTPKCLVPIKGKPLLSYWMEKILSNNIFNIYINTHYLKEKVIDYLNINYKTVKILDEEKLLGTAGSLIKNKDIFYDDDLVVIHSDNYTEDNLNNFFKFIADKNHQDKITIMAFQTKHPKECGIIEVDDNNIMTSFTEKPKKPRGNLANCGIYYFPKKIINNILTNHNDKNDLSTEIIPIFINRAYIYKTNKLFIDIGTPEKYLSVR